LSWVRVILSNQLAKDGFTWGKTFGTEASGTYTNQWQVRVGVDLLLLVIWTLTRCSGTGCRLETIFSRHSSKQWIPYHC
jgi:hypothetical protein